MEAILGGLIGSVLTVIITKILDMIQKSKEHSYALKKEFFGKKLDSAERAVAQWNSSVQALKIMGSLYDYFSTQDESFQNQAFQYLHEKYSAQMQKVVESSSAISNTIDLYFDFERNSEDESIKIFFESLNNLFGLNSMRNILLELKGVLKDTDSEKFVDDEIKKNDQETNLQLKNLSSVLFDAEKEVTARLKIIRNEMKKFES